jgi:hypothetical protein
MSNEGQSFIRQAAISTWHCLCPRAKETKEAKEIEEARRVESFRQELQKIAGSNYDFRITINGGCLEAVIDDLRFVAYETSSAKSKGQLTAVTLLGRCGSCGLETPSKPFYDLAGLGELLERFEPIPWHCCFITKEQG